MYNQKVMEVFANPQHMGFIEDNDGVGKVGNATCGDIMEISLKIKDDVITDAKFRTFGCAAAIATSSVATGMVIGMTVEEALKLTNQGRRISRRAAAAKDTLQRACRRGDQGGDRELLRTHRQEEAGRRRRAEIRLTSNGYARRHRRQRRAFACRKNKICSNKSHLLQTSKFWCGELNFTDGENNLFVKKQNSAPQTERSRIFLNCAPIIAHYALSIMHCSSHIVDQSKILSIFFLSDLFFAPLASSSFFAAIAAVNAPIPKPTNVDNFMFHLLGG